MLGCSIKHFSFSTSRSLLMRTAEIYNRTLWVCACICIIYIDVYIYIYVYIYDYICTYISYVYSIYLYTRKTPKPEIGKHLKSKATLNIRTSYLVSVLKRSLGEHQLPCLYEVTSQRQADLASFGCKKTSFTVPN